MNKCSSNESYFAILFLGDFTRFFNWEERILTYCSSCLSGDILYEVMIDIYGVRSQYLS